MNIKLLSNLGLSSDGLIAYAGAGSSTQEELVHLTQGDLDGACGIYALMMALISLGAITRKQVFKLWDSSPDYRTHFGKALKGNGALMQDGINLEDLLRIVVSINKHSDVPQNIRHLINAEIAQTIGLAAFEEIKSGIDANKPSIVRLDWAGGGAHWVTAIGYQELQNSLESILVLDPGCKSDNTTVWNGVLRVEKHKGPRTFLYWSKDKPPIKCDVFNGLLFT